MGTSSGKSWFEFAWVVIIPLFVSVSYNFISEDRAERALQHELLMDYVKIFKETSDNFFLEDANKALANYVMFETISLALQCESAHHKNEQDAEYYTGIKNSVKQTVDHLFKYYKTRVQTLIADLPEDEMILPITHPYDFRNNKVLLPVTLSQLKNKNNIKIFNIIKAFETIDETELGRSFLNWVYQDSYRRIFLSCYERAQRELYAAMEWIVAGKREQAFYALRNAELLYENFSSVHEIRKHLGKFKAGGKEVVYLVDFSDDDAYEDFIKFIVQDAPFNVPFPVDKSTVNEAFELIKEQYEKIS